MCWWWWWLMSFRYQLDLFEQIYSIRVIGAGFNELIATIMSILYFKGMHNLNNASNNMRFSNWKSTYWHNIQMNTKQTPTTTNPHNCSMLLLTSIRFVGHSTYTFSIFKCSELGRDLKMLNVKNKQTNNQWKFA